MQVQVPTAESKVSRSEKKLPKVGGGNFGRTSDQGLMFWVLAGTVGVAVKHGFIG